MAKEPDPLRLSFRGETFALTPTAEYPFELLETERYEAWIDGILDLKTNARITNNVGRMRRGLFGDWKDVDGVFEMRLDFGPGYRVYYARHGKIVIILLGGGDKSSQQKDIKAARELWERVKDEIKEV